MMCKGHLFCRHTTKPHFFGSEVFLVFGKRKDIVSFSGKNKKRERKNRSLFFHQIVAAYLAAR